MRALVQRVSKASISINKSEGGSVKHGLVVFVGIENEDQSEDIEWLANKILKLRLFDDENGVMNRSVLDVQGSLLLVSQFTLHANTKKGTRPSYIKAAKPDISIPLYNQFVEYIKSHSQLPVLTGEFGAHMDVSLTNDGPVTIWLDSKNKAY